MKRLGLVMAVWLGSSACIKGGGQTPPGRDEPQAGDIALPEGYRIELVADGLEFPVGVAFDDAQVPYVVEAGYSYGELFTTPRIVRIDPSGDRTVIAQGTNPPWNGITFHAGRFYVAEGSQLTPGRILEIDAQGSTRALVTGLPSLGDHHTNGPIIGPDGALYFGQGTATNSGVVGEDDAEFGWLSRFPGFHDVPCADVTLSGENFVSGNPLTSDGDDSATTGAFLPFGTPSTQGQVIKGALPCTGAVMRVRLPAATAEGQSAPLELVAWGFRNPFGLAFGPDGSLFVTDNGFDERGSRPIFGAGDLLWKVEEGRWYGWPDYSGGRPVDTQRFKQLGKEPPKRLFTPPPSEPPAALAFLAVHSSSNGFDIGRSEAFGHVGDAFIAQFGDMAPGVGNVVQPVGFKVVRVDLSRGVVHDFAANRGNANGPASYLNSGGLERPVAARFSPDGTALYIVDFGVLSVGANGPEPREHTGRLWKVTHE